MQNVRYEKKSLANWKRCSGVIKLYSNKKKQYFPKLGADTFIVWTLSRISKLKYLNEHLSIVRKIILSFFSFSLKFYLVFVLWSYSREIWFYTTVHSWNLSSKVLVFDHLLMIHCLSLLKLRQADKKLRRNW